MCYVVDESYEKVQEISDKVSYAVKADVSEPDDAAGSPEDVILTEW